MNPRVTTSAFGHGFRLLAATTFVGFAMGGHGHEYTFPSGDVVTGEDRLHTEYSPVCYVVFDGADTSGKRSNTAEAISFGGPGTGIIPIVSAPNTASLALRNVQWNLSSFRLVGTQIMHEGRYDGLGNQTDNGNEYTEIERVVDLEYYYYPFPNAVRTKTLKGTYGWDHPAPGFADLQPGFPRANDPKFQGGTRGRGYQVCLADYTQATGSTREDFVRGYSRPYFAGAEPTSLGAYMTYFYMSKPVPTSTDLIAEMVDQGLFYLNEDNDGTGGLLAPRSNENDESEIWRCASPEPQAEDDSGTMAAPLGARMRPFTAARARDIQSASSVTRCPRPGSEGTSVTVENLQPGSLYDVFVGAMLVPETVDQTTTARDGLAGAAHMFAPEVYTMPFDDHDGEFGYLSRADVVLPDSTNGETNATRHNAVVVEYDDMPSSNTAVGVPLIRNDIERCRRVDGHTGNQISAATSVSANYGCTKDTSPTDRRPISSPLVVTGTGRKARIGLPAMGSYAAAEILDHLPYGQTIQGVRFFVPDVPRRPLVQIQSFDGPASPGRWFGDPNPTVPTDKGRAIPRAVVPNANGRVKLRLWPRLNYGMYTTYLWSESVDGGEFSDPVDVLIGGAAREVSDQGVHTILTAADGYEWEVDAVIGSTYQFQVTATSDVVDALDKPPQVRLLNRVLIGELPEIRDIQAVSGLRQATFTWDVDTMADLPIIATRYRRHKFNLPDKQCVDGERQVKFCGDVVDGNTLVLPNCDPVPDGAGWVNLAPTTGVTLDGLERGATYNFGLRVRNHAGESETVWKCVDIGVAPSAPVVTPLLRSADCPNDPEDTARARGCFDFRWEPAVDGGFPVEEYQYFAIPAAEFEEQFPDFPEDPEGGPDDDDSRWVLICGKDRLDSGNCPFSASVEDLDLATGYQLLVRARNADGWGRVAFGVVNTLPAAPEAPEDLSAAAGNAALTLTWLAGPDNGAEILAYQYRARPEAATTWSAYVSVEPECTETRAGTECSLAVGGLTNDTEYVFELRAVNSAGFGAEASVTGTPQVAALAAVVTGLREDDSSSSCADFVCNVAFEWTTPQAGCPDRYEYGWVAGRWQSHQCSLQDATCQRADDTVRSCEEVAATGVDAGDSLVFRVRPVVDGRAGSETSITVVAGDPPAEPDNPAATAGVGAITLTWDDPGGPVQRYEYRFRVSGADGAIPGTWSDWLDAGLAERVAIDGLTNGQKYDFEVRAVNAVGTGEVAGSPELYGKAPVAGTAAPGAPGTPQVTVADAEVTLEWPAAELAGDGGNASQYGCRYRASGTIPWEGCASGGVVVDSDTNDATAAVTVTGLVNGLTYEFEIWTIGADDLESDRVTAEGTPLLGSAAPGSPQNLVATPGDGRVTLRWEPAVSTDGVAVAGYEYRWRRVGGAFGAWTDACGFADAERARCRSVVEWSVDALANGTQVQFELRARKGENLTGPVATVWATPRGAPGAPLGLRHAAGDGELSVFWHPPNDGGSPILRYEYRVRVGEAGFGDWQLVDDRLIESGARYTLLLANVRDDIDYVVEVRAVNEAGDGAAASVARLAGTAASEAFSASAGDREVELRWPAATGGDIARYEFRCLPETSGCIGWVDASNRLRRDGNWLVVTVAGLANGTAYTFELRTIDSQGNPGAPDQTTATPSGTPGVPTVQVTPGDGEAILTWQPPAQDGGAPVLHYEYRWSVAGEAFGTWRAHRTGGARIVVGGLANGREHVFAVRAVNPAGPGPEARAAVTPGAAPSAPGQLTATRGDGAVTLRWSAPGADGGVAVSEYQYRYRRADATAFGDWASVGAVTVVTVAGLDNGVEYLFEVRAANAVLVGPRRSPDGAPGRGAGRGSLNK
ncbi:MAG: fibronectin type III domain-containing protein, partial [Gammaproteobacteria bacterium]|nr:fibronectin type III domain-containing protein [Gammaproteobacteria bacterium]